MSQYRIETDVHFTFENGQILCKINGQTIDLMKLDTVQEVRVAFFGMATEALGNMVSASHTANNADLLKSSPELSLTDVQQLGETFQQQYNEAKDKLREEIKSRLDDVRSSLDESAFVGTGGDSHA